MSFNSPSMMSSGQKKFNPSIFQTPSKISAPSDKKDEENTIFTTPDIQSGPLPKTPPNSAPTQNNVCPPTPYILGNKSSSRSPFTTSKKGRHFSIGTHFNTISDVEMSLDTNHPVRDSTPTFQRDNRYKYNKVPLFGPTSNDDENFVTPLKKLKTNKNPFADNDDVHELSVERENNIPQFLSFFSTVKALGNGSFGQVFLCRHRTDGWNYAVKKIKYKNQNEKDQFLHEVYLLAAIGNHPHFIRYHNSFSDEIEKTIYVQTEFCNSGSLNSCVDQLKKKVKRKEEVYYETLRQIGTALNYLHNVMKCVHMDVKPENIFVCEEKDKRIIFKLGDFGRSRVATDDQSRFIDPDEIDGDGKYLAPELLKTSVQEYLLPKVDIYSLALSILSIAGVKNPNDKSSFTKYFDDSLSKLLCKMLIENPLERISSQELIEDPLLLHPEIRKVKHEIDNIMKIKNQINKKSSSKYVRHMGRIPSFELSKAVKDIRKSVPTLSEYEEDDISTEDENERIEEEMME